MTNNTSSLNHIVEDSLTEIYICETESLHYLYANKAAINNIGYTLDELLSIPSITLTPQYSLSQMKELLHPLHTSNANPEIVINGELTRKDGTRYPVDLHIQLTEHDNQAAYAVFVHDATEQKLALDQLHLVIKGASLGYWDWNNSTQVFYVDEYWLKMLGLKPQAIKNEIFAWFKLIHPDDRAMVVNSLKIIRLNQPYVMEFRMLHKDGHTLWIQSAGSVVAWDYTENKPLRVCGIHQDITARKKDEIEKQQFQKFFEVSTDIMFIAKLDGLFRKANPAAIKTLGFSESEILSKRVIDIVFPDDKVRTLNELQKQIRTGRSVNFENRCICKDGSYRWLSWQSSYNELDDISYATARDITQQKLIEEELQKIQKLTSLGVLAGGIAHDFNNILTILFGNISLAKSLLPPPHESYDALQKAEQAFFRATDLTTQLLTFAKGGDPVKKKFCFNKLVKETTNFVLSGSNVKVFFEFDDGLWAAIADEGQISQVISNLIINANQSMPEGGSLYLSLENSLIGERQITGLSAGRYIQFVIRDNGIGIPENHLSQIFDPYYTTKKTGNGLGLATVYSIINKHGGKISAHSKLNQGTKFVIYLPALDELPKESHTLIEEKPSCPIKQLKVLIMDDEPLICKLAQDILKSVGYIVKTAKNGTIAIEMYKSALEKGEHFSCIIMDLTIPGDIGGKEAVSVILALNPEAKVIVSSGYAEDPVMANFKDYGFQGVISKPFTVESLKAEVDELLR